MSLEQVIISLSYAGIFFLMILNGVVSFPSSQIMYLIAGYFAYAGDLNIFWIVFIGAIGNTIGNVILYEISRKHGLKYVLKVNEFIGFEFFRKKDISKVERVFEKRGVWFLFVGKLINPIKIIIPIPAGMAKMSRAIFIPIVFVASLIWASVFTYLGFFFGKSYEGLGIYGVVMIVLALTFGFIFYKYMNSDGVVEELK